MGSSKGWKRKATMGASGRGWVVGVGVVEDERREGFGGGIAEPEVDVGLRDAGEGFVELDAFGAEEGELRGEEQGAAFAGADVEEDGGVRWGPGVRCAGARGRAAS